MKDEQKFDAEAVVDAMAPLLGLSIDEEFRSGVIANLLMTVELATIVISFPLDEREDPASVFSA